MNTGKTVSLRQALVATVLAGLSLAAAQAGQMDWKWGLVGVVVSVPLIQIVMKRLSQGPVYRGAWGTIRFLAFAGWSVFTLGHVLRQAAHRMELTGGSQGVAVWMILLLALPVVWMGWGKPAAFFRGSEIYWMVMVAVLLVIGVLALPHVQMPYLWMNHSQGWHSVLMGAGVVSTAAWVLPYLFQTGLRESAQGKTVTRWLLLLGTIAVALSLLTQGVLGAGKADLSTPFFITMGVLGESARTEGLLSALWLICDLAWAGLLIRVWGGGRGPVICAVLGTVVALLGWTEGVAPWIWSMGNIILAILAVLPLGREGSVVVSF